MRKADMAGGKRETAEQGTKSAADQAPGEAEIAKVVIGGIPYAIDKPYDYLIPEGLLDSALPGVRVKVPFGKSNPIREGIVVSRGFGAKRQGMKPLREVLDAAPIFGAEEIALALWMRRRYFCTFFDAAKAIVPAGILFREPPAQKRSGNRAYLMASLTLSAREAMDSARTSSARQAVIEFLSAAERASCADICYYTGAEMSLLRRMEKSGLLEFTREDAVSGWETAGEAEPPAALDEQQRRAFEALLPLMDAPKAGAALLYGVTGSGKTLVYLHLAREALRRGKTALILVPEVILTPQIMRKFSSAFGKDAALLHGSMPAAQRRETWLKIRRGEARVVLGTRSAIFAPLRNLGLVVLDEEQDGSYQSGQSPRYHTRDVAKYLCARDRAALVLGSATPSVETFWNAEQGNYQKAVLRERYNGRNLPDVLISDLREELRAGNSGVIGRALRGEIQKNLEAGEQSVLFLNRRGNSRMLLCGECGYVPECPRCSVPMTYHSANGRLMCHYCWHSQIAEAGCPACGGRMKRIGVGTQKAEEELKALFPDTEILRMDTDAAAGKKEKLLARFETGRIPILLGTQMVAKGLDFENVTLAGALLADSALYQDHYRAAERTFSLLTQITGRAGRGERRGRAVIQTYTPDNSVIQSAAKQDYERFYQTEIRLRRLRRYPPFADLFTLTVSGIEESAVLRAAALVRDTLRALCRRPQIARWQPEVLGPAPAPVLKVNNFFRYRVLFVGKNDRAARDALDRLIGGFFEDKANQKLHLCVDCNSAD